jgi:hypothetical protein
MPYKISLRPTDIDFIGFIKTLDVLCVDLTLILDIIPI